MGTIILSKYSINFFNNIFETYLNEYSPIGFSSSGSSSSSLAFLS